MKKAALFLYNLTPFMAQPWFDAGYTVFCVDGQHSAGITQIEPGWFNVGMWLNRDRETRGRLVEMLKDYDVRFVAGFPPCDDMAVSGARWFEAKLAADPLCQVTAVHRAKLVMDMGVLLGAPWMAENPRSVLSTMWRRPDHTFNPCDYGGYLPEGDEHPLYPDVIPGGDAYQKTTCLWTGGGFRMPPRKPVPAVGPDYPGYRLLGGKSLRTKNIRSATPRGLALAIYRSNKS